MTLVFDSSALVKMLIPEEDSGLALGLWTDPGGKAASTLAASESTAALGAAERAGRLTPQGTARSLRRLEGMWNGLCSIAVSEQIAWAAGQLARERALSGADAVHLATAISISDDEAALVTFDRRLAMAALSCGVNVIPDPGP